MRLQRRYGASFLAKGMAVLAALGLIPGCGSPQTGRGPTTPSPERAATEAGDLDEVVDAALVTNDPASTPAEDATRLDEADRRLYADLAAGVHSGQDELVRMLGAVPTRTIAFRLSDGGALPIDEGLVTADYLDADLAVFHRIAEGADGQPLWLHFDHRSMSLESAKFARVEVPAPVSDENLDVPAAQQDVEATETLEAETEVTTVGQLQWRLYRSLPVKRDRHAVLGFTFVLDDDTISAQSTTVISPAEADQRLPVNIPERGEVVFLQADQDGRHVLMAAPAAGGASRAVISDQDFDLRHPRLLSDGRLVAAADAEGDYRLYQIDLELGRMRTFVRGDEHQRPSVPRYLLAGLAVDGKIEARIVRVPDTLDLLSVVALVSAHNPAVNRRRALLAASLAEAGATPTAPVDAGETPRYGLFGLTDRNFSLEAARRLSADGKLRAEIARDAVELELADQQFAAIELFFRCRQHDSVIDLLKARSFAGRQRHELLTVRRATGHALGAEVLRLEAELEEIAAKLQWRERMRSFATRRLAEICGLPAEAPLQLGDEQFRCDRGFAPRADELYELALLNHPRLRSSRLALGDAFDTRTAPRQSNGGFLGAAGMGRSRFGDPLDGYIATGGDVQRRGSADERRANLMSALRLAEEQATRAVAGDVEAALNGYEGARLEHARLKAQLTASLEDLRLARLHAELDTGRDNAPNPAAHLQARERYLASLAQQVDARWDVSRAFARVWREASLPRRMVREVQQADADRVAQRRPAVWLELGAATLADDQAINAFVADLATRDAKRCYIDLGAAAAVLDDPLMSGRLDMLLNRSAMAEIAVWVSLGTKEQFADPGSSDFRQALRRLRSYSARHHSFEPTLAGVQLRFSPTADPRWRDDELFRDDALALLQAKIDTVRDELGTTLPLWLIAAPELFDPMRPEMVQGLAGQVDGLSLIAASNRREQIIAWSLRAFALWGAGIEIALELSPDVPAERSLAAMPLDERQALVDELITLHVNDERFAGVAFHDYRAMIAPPAQPDQQH